MYGVLPLLKMRALLCWHDNIKPFLAKTCKGETCQKRLYLGNRKFCSRYCEEHEELPF